MTELVVLEGVALALLGLLVLGLLRSHAEILRRLHQLGVGLDPSAPPGVPAQTRPTPAVGADAVADAVADAGAADAAGFETADAAGFETADALDIMGVTPAGHAAAIGVVGAAHDTLLSFLSSGCLTCARFWEAFARPDRLGLPPRTRLLVVTKGPDGDSPSALAKVAPADVTVVMSTPAWEGYGIPGSPYFVLVDGRRGRVVGQTTGDNWDDVRARLGLAAEHGPGSATASAAAATAAAAATTAEAEARRGHDPDRRDRVDADLLAAGIGPGHPSLYTEPPTSPPPPAVHEPET